METAVKRTPKISEAEWEVMKVLWEDSPKTANDIVEELTGTTSWKRETIRTLINRLVAKKALNESITHTAEDRSSVKGGANA